MNNADVYISGRVDERLPVLEILQDYMWFQPSSLLEDIMGAIKRSNWEAAGTSERELLGDT